VLVAEFLVAAKAANLSLPIFGGDALADYMLYEQLRGRPSLIDTLTTTSVSPGSKEYVQAFTNYTGGQASTSYQAYAAHAYDAVAALLRAYKAAAPPKDGPAIKAEIGKLDFQGELQRWCVMLQTARTCSMLGGMRQRRQQRCWR
jgi:ABC-type branched-subunit amino acid transport system substrate-binding protein